MLILFLLTFVAFSASLHGMDKQPENLYKILDSQKTFADFCDYCTQTKESTATIINASQNPRLLTYCAYKFLPKDISAAIGTGISKPLVKKYKHKLIRYKWLNNQLKAEEKIDCPYDQWNQFCYHDGTYFLVPSAYTYCQWKEHSTNGKNEFFIENKRYLAKLMCPVNKEGLSSHFAVLDTDNHAEKKKNFILCQVNQNNKRINSSLFTCNKRISHYRFSYDGALLAYAASKDNTISIINTKANDDSFYHKMNGPISVICSAHHSPVFVIGSYKNSTSELPNLLLYTSKHTYNLPGHDAPIVSAEFRPDDSHLLTLSYDEKENSSVVQLWDTSNFNKIQFLYRELRSKYITHKAFFICEGEKIMLMQKNGRFELLDTLTKKILPKNTRSSSDEEKDILTLSSKKNKLIINSYRNTLTLYSSKDGKLLAYEGADNITALGLTADENNIIITDQWQEVYKIPLYTPQDCDEIDFIEKKANLVQLYEMLTIYQQNEKEAEVKNLIKLLKEYIAQ
jgi:hypothetical protein